MRELLRGATEGAEEMVQSTPTVKEPLSLNVRQGRADITSQGDKENGMVRKEVETWMEEISKGCTSCVSKTHPFA